MISFFKMSDAWLTDLDSFKKITKHSKGQLGLGSNTERWISFYIAQKLKKKIAYLDIECGVWRREGYCPRWWENDK